MIHRFPVPPRSLLAAAAFMTVCSSSFSAVIYVNANAIGNNHGRAWDGAYRELASALNAATPGDEIWVAKGTYFPDYDPVTFRRTGNRSARFPVKNGLKLFGGFNGTETARHQRNWAANRTILSGDIGQFGVATDNTQTIMASATTETVRGVLIEGVIFTGGRADITAGAANGLPGSTGGAFNIYEGEAELRHCTFVGNFAVYGGAIHIRTAVDNGLNLVNCTFASNTATYVGGAIDFQSYTGKFGVHHCTLVNNVSSRGSAIGVNTMASSSYFNNLIVSNPGNTGWERVEVGNGTSVTENNILQEALQPVGTQNLVVGNTVVVTPPSAGPDQIWGTADDVLTATLTHGSAGIDYGTSARLPADSTDLDGDGDTTEPIPFDGAHTARVKEQRVDVGAFEYLDTVTVAPTLFTPNVNGMATDTIPVSYTLPEAALSGSLKLSFTHRTTALTRSFILSNEAGTVGQHVFSFSPAQAYQSPFIVGGADSLPDGVYHVTLSYQDARGNPAASVMNPNYSINTAAPTLTLDDGSAAYSELDPPIFVAPSAQVTDAASDWVGGSLTVKIASNAAPEDVLSLRNVNGITTTGATVFYLGSYIADCSPATGSVNGINTISFFFTTKAENEAVQALVRSIAFHNTSVYPPTATRTVEFTLLESAGFSVKKTRQIAVAAVESAPSVLLFAKNPTFVEGKNQPSVSVQLDNLLLVRDDDSLTMTRASVAITEGFTPGQDFLIRTPGEASISSNYDAQTGVMTLTAVGAPPTIDKWHTTLRGLRYLNTSEDPNPAHRSITFIINDGTSDSAPATMTLQVVPTNDTPTARPIGLQRTQEDTPITIKLEGTDPENQPLTYFILTLPRHGTLSKTGSPFTYIPAQDYHGSDSFTFAAFDGAATSAPVTVNIEVSSLNDPPQVSDIPDVEIFEDSGTQLIPISLFTAGGLGETETVSLSAASNNASIVLDPTVYQLGNSASALLAIKPAPNGNGVAVITVTADDGQFENSVTTKTFQVRVLPVNDAPTFDRGSDVTAAQDAGAQTIPAWAKNITSGPSDEAGQTVQFIVNVDHPEWFTRRPAITPSGTLTFTPAPDASGTATVEVLLRDNGSLAHGGVNLSDLQTFQITLTTYAEERGNYTGLVQPLAGQPDSRDHHGLLRLTTTKTGNFTGTLRQSGTVHVLTGRFGKDGVAHFGTAGATTLPLKRKGQPLRMLSLQLDVANSTGLTGWVTENGSPLAEVVAERDLVAVLQPATPTQPAVLNPALINLRGRYTAALTVDEPLLDTVVYPPGHGIGTLTVRTDGLVVLTGFLQDGSPITCSAPISEQGHWALYFDAAKGQGLLSGRVIFRDQPGESDLDGNHLRWFKSARTSVNPYPAAWEAGLTVKLVGSRFTLPPSTAGVSLLPGLNYQNGLPNADLTFDEDVLTAPGFRQAVIISTTNRLTVPSENPARVKATLATSGLFSGSFLHPVFNQRKAFRGVVLQKQGKGVGFFVGHVQAGRVVLQPRIPEQQPIPSNLSPN